MGNWLCVRTECYVLTNAQPGAQPVYRAWDGSNHIFSTNKVEYDSLPPHYQREGVAFHIWKTPGSGRVPLIRFHNRSKNDHLLTAEAAEDTCLQKGPVWIKPKNQGYQIAGYMGLNPEWSGRRVLGYVKARPDNLHTPLYRLFNSRIHDHFYTRSLREAESATGVVLPDADLPADLIVRSINMQAAYPDKLHRPSDAARARAFAKILHDDWSNQVGLVGLQETAGVIQCLAQNSRKTSGSHCLALELRRLFNEESSGRDFDDDVGVVVDSNWKLESVQKWELGAWLSRRYLVEAVVEHRQFKRQLRFYSTHLSSAKGAKGAGRREAQAKELVDIVRSRARPGEFPPIVVGDFNAPRNWRRGAPYIDDAEKSVKIMEKYFWRASDTDNLSRSSPVRYTGIDLVYVGKKSVFSKSVGRFRPVQRRKLDIQKSPIVVDGRHYLGQLTDHPIEQHTFKIELDSFRAIPKFGYGNGWRTEQHLRMLADLNGDGCADIVGFGHDGVVVARSNGNGTFLGPQRVINNFGYGAGGWRIDRHPRMLADLTGDRRPDVVGFGNKGVYVARNNGSGVFGPPQWVLRSFGYSTGGWRVDRHPRHMVDLTGDGCADIVAFGDKGIYVARNRGNGTFYEPRFVVPSFGYVAGGWRVDKHPRVLADTTGDGRPDIVGFANAGVYVARNKGNGTFAAPVKVMSNFGYVAGGWRVNKHPRFMIDVTGDGRADIVGFANAGVYVAMNKGNGTFHPPRLVVDGFGQGAGWRVDKHPRFVIDVTGDGLPDVVGFANDGVYVAWNKGKGTFSRPALLVEGFGYEAGGWRVDRHPRLLADVTGTGHASVVGFGQSGVYLSLVQWPYTRDGLSIGGRWRHGRSAGPTCLADSCPPSSATVPRAPRPRLTRVQVAGVRVLARLRRWRVGCATEAPDAPREATTQGRAQARGAVLKRAVVDQKIRRGVNEAGRGPTSTGEGCNHARLVQFLHHSRPRK